MRLRFTILLAIMALTTGLIATGATPAAAVDSPRGSTHFDAYFPSGDGTELKAEVILPEGGCDDVDNTDGTTGCPTIVSIGPYFGSGSQNGAALGFGDVLNDGGVSNRFFDFFAYEFDQGDGTTANVFEMGYAVVQVDSRGFGTSGGCNDYGGHGEQMDAAAAVTWASTQDWSNGNVGMWGKSYDGWTQVMALAENPPALDAVVIQAPIIDGYGIAFVNGVHHDTGWYITTNLYALYDYSGGSINEDPRGHVNNVTGLTGVNPNNNGIDTPACWAQQNAEVLNPDRDWYFWVERDLRPRASVNDDVAVFWTHGFTDNNTKSDQVFGVYEGLNEGNADQTRAWFGQWDHKRGSDVRGGSPDDGNVHNDWIVGRAGWNEEALDWLNHYLRGDAFLYEVNSMMLVEAQDQFGNWRTEAQYPSTDVRMLEMPIRPGTYTDEGSDDGYWSISPEVTDAFRITGESTVTLDVTTSVPNAQFVGVLYNVDDGGYAEEISRTMYRIPSSGVYTFRTHPGDYIIEDGNYLGFKIMSNHPESFPYSTYSDVTVNGGSIAIPVPEFERVINLGGVETSARDFYDADYDGDFSSDAVEMDIDAWGARPYTQADADAGIPHPQGSLNPTRPVQ